MRPTILSFLKTLIPGGPVYVRVSRRSLDLFDVASGRRFSASPTLVVLDPTKRNGSVLETLADPSQLSQDGLVRMNGFDHPRTILSDFTVAERTLQLALAELFRDKVFTPSPIIVIHPLEKTEGGLTMIERRAFRELCEGAGARNVYVWEGRELSDVELSSDSLLDEIADSEA